ncbi:hypothetical protein FB45DRAFT_352883 [Roridomyces roridus]|uniref:F-box domain-containing protein n=1 Tax=Roridomyces roridus TaxID=1738132 RepID=A0AAD7FSK8_9AGAR|nr:hypothetical protein FB45DRAFT_352883 [Roridomyces roridus]
MAQQHSKASAVLAADRAHIAEIDAQIAELEERIRLLRIDREATQRRLDAYTYPVLTLPPELVSEIFLHTLPAYPACPPLTGPASPISLTHICQSWREVAIATPLLWRAIAFICAEQDLGGQTEVVRTWLDRSGSCPLSVKIETEPGLVGNREEIPLYRERWEQVAIAATGHMLGFLLRDSMPMLRSLSVTMEYEGSRPAMISLDLPSLRTVSLNWFQYPVNWLPWNQVTSLTLESMYSRNCIPVLRDAIHLEDLTLINCDFFDIANESRIPLTQLKTLVATWNVVEILHLITVPALQTLELSGAELGEDPTGTLASLISRSSIKLQKLRICGRYRLPVPMETFLGAFPMIPDIVFMDESGSDFSE